MESDHGLTCECGQTFKTSQALTEHLTTREVLKEVKRIGGTKYYEIVKQWEEDAHCGDLREFIANRDQEMKPANATQIAKEEIKHIVDHHDEYHITDTCSNE